jgi:hypothetical protein
MKAMALLTFQLDVFTGILDHSDPANCRILNCRTQEKPPTRFGQVNVSISSPDTTS